MYKHEHRLRRIVTLILLSIVLVGTGLPLRTGTMAGEKGMQTYGAPRDIVLVFDGTRLVAWKTDRTVNELRARAQ